MTKKFTIFLQWSWFYQSKVPWTYYQGVKLLPDPPRTMELLPPNSPIAEAWGVGLRRRGGREAHPALMGTLAQCGQQAIPSEAGRGTDTARSFFQALPCRPPHSPTRLARHCEVRPLRRPAWYQTCPYSCLTHTPA